VSLEILAIGADDDAGIAAYVEIRRQVTPESPDSVEHAHWEDAAYPGAVFRFLAAEGGAVVGAGVTGRIHMHAPEFERYWLGLWVAPEARRHGIGSTLFDAVSDAARRMGKTGFQTDVSEEHADGIRFLLHRGFVVTDRTRVVRLDLAGRTPPDVATPPGITLTSLAARPDLIESVHGVAVEAFPDVPTGVRTPLAALDLRGFIERDVDRPGVPKDGFIVAVDRHTGEAVGYASLIMAPGSRTTAYHGMTAVRPAWRGRGIATALKQATIRWAVEHGLEALETGNDEVNAPMRAVNAALGYRPLPDELGVQGPLAPDRPGPGA
jgi:GNAT superfamily N-acetyltransferase